MPREEIHFCPRCESAQAFTKPPPLHAIHLVATICSVGLWAVPWLAVTIHHSRQPWRCDNCGTRLRGRSGTSENEATSGSAPEYESSARG